MKPPTQISHPRLLFLGVLALSTMTPSFASAEPATPPADYWQHCAVCHGANARGDGMVASGLKTQPTDLTRLAARNGGQFPTARVRKAITGTLDERTIARFHGPEEMPVWGKRFRDESDSHTIANARINAIVDYLKSVQR